MPHSLRLWLPVLIVLILALIARYLWIQPLPMGQLCAPGAGGPWWCEARDVLIQAYTFQRLGYVALVLAVLAVFTRSRRISVLAACVSAAGLVLYCFEMSAVGLVLSVLTLARVAQPPQPAVGA